MTRWLSCSDHFLNHDICIPFWTTLEAELTKYLNTKIIDVSLILLLVKFHDFKLCGLRVMFFYYSYCRFHVVLDSNKLILFLTMLKVKLVFVMNTKVVVFFSIFPTVYNSLSYLKYKFRYMLLKRVVGF